MAMMFLFASIDCAIDLRTISAKLFEHLTHRSLTQTPWLMMTIELIILALIVIRVLFEVRASKVSLACVVLVWIGFVGCIALRNIQLPENIDWVDQNIAYGNCILLGCVGSLVSLTVYSRFVFLHAHGLIRFKITKPTKQTGDSAANEKIAKGTRKKAKTKVAAPQPEAAVSSTQTQKTTVKHKVVPASSDEPATAKPARKKKAAAAPTPKPQPTQTQSKKVVKQKVVTTAKPASKPKQKPSTKPPASESSFDDIQEVLDEIDTVPMSKSERRRQRKLAKRAARAKKAA